MRNHTQAERRKKDPEHTHNPHVQKSECSRRAKKCRNTEKVERKQASKTGRKEARQERKEARQGGFDSSQPCKG